MNLVTHVSVTLKSFGNNALKTAGKTFTAKITAPKLLLIPSPVYAAMETGPSLKMNNTHVQATTERTTIVLASNHTKTVQMAHAENAATMNVSSVALMIPTVAQLELNGAKLHKDAIADAVLNKTPLETGLKILTLTVDVSTNVPQSPTIHSHHLTPDARMEFADNAATH